MALYRALRNLKLLHLHRFSADVGLPGRSLTQVRHAWYPTSHVNPVPDKEAFTDGQLPVDISVPVKAAPHYVSSTFLYDPLISKFVNVMMKRGQKHTSQEIMTKTFALIKMRQLELYNKAPEEEKASIETDPVQIFHQAIENTKPLMGLSSVKRGGKNYQVPTPLSPQRQRFIAMKWILDECNVRPKKQHMQILLSQEFCDAFNNTGKAVKRKQNMHKMCEANKAFAHFRWWDSS